jgi:hypothetical protein
MTLTSKLESLLARAIPAWQSTHLEVEVPPFGGESNCLERIGVRSIDRLEQVVSHSLFDLLFYLF